MNAIISSAVPAEAAELQHDLSGIDPTPMLDRALEEVISGVLSGQVVRGFGRSRADIQSLLAAHMDEDDQADALARLLVCSDEVLVDLRSEIRAEFERTLRRELCGSELVQDVAARLGERDE